MATSATKTPPPWKALRLASLAASRSSQREAPAGYMVASIPEQVQGEQQCATSAWSPGLDILNQACRDGEMHDANHSLLDSASCQQGQMIMAIDCDEQNAILMQSGGSTSQLMECPGVHPSEELIAECSTTTLLQLPQLTLQVTQDLDNFNLVGLNLPLPPFQSIPVPNFACLPAYPTLDPQILMEMDAKLAAMWETQKGFAEHLTNYIDGVTKEVASGFGCHANNLVGIHQSNLENTKAIQQLAQHLTSLGPHLMSRVDIEKNFQELYNKTATALGEAEAQLQILRAKPTIPPTAFQDLQMKLANDMRAMVLEALNGPALQRLNAKV